MRTKDIATRLNAARTWIVEVNRTLQLMESTITTARGNLQRLSVFLEQLRDDLDKDVPA